MHSIKFIAYADVHHDERAANCLTLSDTLGVEVAVHQRVVEGGFDFSLFLGDRYLKREPKDEVKVISDRTLFNQLSKRVAPHFHLIGNHDWVNNAQTWHTSETLRSVCEVWAAPMTRVYEDQHVVFHTLPAGIDFDRGYYSFDRPDLFNIFVFHDQVIGSVSSDSGVHKFTSGISLADIDLPEFDLVLAGDNHVPQEFNLKNSQGRYLGSVLQRTFADAQKARGWWEIEVMEDRTITQKFVPTRNFFTRYILEVDDGFSYHDATTKIEEAWITDQAVEITLQGNKENVDRLADNDKWSNYVDILGARNLNILRGYVADVPSAQVNMQGSRSTQDDLNVYLSSGFVDIGGLDSARLLDILANTVE